MAVLYDSNTFRFVAICYVMWFVIPLYEFDVTLCGYSISFCDFIVTLCELDITLCAFIITLCGFVIRFCWFNPFMQSGFFYNTSLDQSISNKRGV